MELLNKNIVITGAANGIGEALARHFLKLKANVFLSDRNQKKLGFVAEKLGCAHHVCDVGKEEDILTLVKQANADLGHIDLFCSNAGIFFKDEFIKWANNKVILVELDFPRKSKLPENIQKQNRELAQNFGVRGYPSIYFVQPKKNSKGIELSAIGKSGYVAGGPNAWIKAASQYIK